ncbi:MAG: hypothetical protein CL927_14585 [Deltaproteobacteria bacterium]|nr:hypothetical protein [Deltaproteobacteria bacterium]HCH63815.1 hypothetical protein [Deltaproteobacteria bacterium]
MTEVPAHDLAALNAYIDGWRRGDAKAIHRVQAPAYHLSGVPGVPPVPREAFVEFFGAFRAQIADAGGPAVDSTAFMEIHGQIRRQVGDTTVESALFVVPGFGAGTYAAAVRDGQILWEEACMLALKIEAG